MTKKHRARRQANPFSSYMNMFSVGMDMSELFYASSQVILHRSKMMGDAMTGKLPFHHKEFQAMWHEKMIAGADSMHAAMRHMGSAEDGASFLAKIMAPYHKKATSNARRLGKK